MASVAPVNGPAPSPRWEGAGPGRSSRRLRTRDAELADVRRDLSGIGYTVAIEVAPGGVCEREDRDLSDRLAVARVQRSGILLGLRGDGLLIEKVQLELEVAGGRTGEVAANW
jgi:hypothetical protein